MFDRSKWEIREQDPDKASELAQALETTPICARLLISRGLSDPCVARSYINKIDSKLYDPYLLKDMDKAAARIKKAMDDGEKITIYGDYDVDGVTAVTTMYTYLSDRNVSVDYYIPERENEGYGLNCGAIDAIAKSGTTLIVTVDTGITAIEDVEHANELGIDIVITDHHRCRETLPDAVAVVDPHRPDCEYPFKDLSGVGVAFKTVCAVQLACVCGGEYNEKVIENMCRRYIDLVTIGTVADVMPLTDENRTIVARGLKMLRNTKRFGIKALMQLAGVDTSGSRRITASTIGYSIAPRINAAGRMSSASRAVHLFLAESERSAQVVAEELCNINKYRKEVEEEITKEAIEQIARERDPKNEKVLVLSSDKWHHGVIGIVASRLAEKYNVPCVLVSFDGSGDEGKGSARSIKGINLAEALAYCSDTLTKYGGHEQAAGLSVRRDMLCRFRERLSEYVKAHMSECELENKLQIDTVIEPDEVTESTVYSISKLEPFGEGNPPPLFVLKNAKVVQITPIKDGKYSKLLLEREGRRFTGLFFHSGLQDQKIYIGDWVDIACGIDINDFKGARTVQLIIHDIDIAGSFEDTIAELQRKCDSLIFGGEISFEISPPSREFCVEIYKRTIAAAKDSIAIISIKELISDMGYSHYLHTGIALAAFKQLGFIEIEKISDFDYKITFIKQTEKKDIFSAPIMSQK